MEEKKEYRWEELFDIKKEEVVYKEKNSIHNIYYNQVGINGILDTSSDVPFITFPSLKKIPFIRHGFSTRLGGVSKEHWSTLNLSFSRGDEEKAVCENYNRILSSMGLQDTTIIFSDQVHDTKVHVVTESDFSEKGCYEKKLVGIDGLITNQKNVTLVTSYADCVPLYFVDPVKKVIGLSHSGWRGTVNRIGAKTVQKMQEEFGSNPEELITVIGPSICFDCYEISENVAEEFKNRFYKEQVKLFLYKKGNGKYLLDLWLVNKFILKEAGVLEKNISNSNICTCCNSSLLYSHRASKGMRGNLAAFLAIVD